MLQSKKLALSGICASLSVICLIGVGFLPTLNIAFSCLASLLCIVPMLNQPIKSIILSVIVFLVSGALGFFITGNILELIPFYIFFAPYAILKTALDKVKIKLVFKIMIKYIYLNLAVVALFFLSKLLIDATVFNEFIKNFGIIAIVVVNLIIMPYDYAFNEGVNLLNKLVLRFFNK